MVDTVHEGYLNWPELSKPVMQYSMGYSKVCECCVEKCVHICTVMDSTSEHGETDEFGEFYKYVWFPGELKAGLGYPEQRLTLA